MLRLCRPASPSRVKASDRDRTVVRLFHPRRDVWSEPFEWHGGWVRGRSPEGRATIQVLRINDANAVAVRESLTEEGLALD